MKIMSASHGRSQVVNGLFFSGWIWFWSSAHPGDFATSPLRNSSGAFGVGPARYPVEFSQRKSLSPKRIALLNRGSSWQASKFTLVQK
jgi:hypothetical protein